MSSDYLNDLRAAIPMRQHTPFRHYDGVWMIKTF
jgi:hypothetical protein